ncbi:MAG: hypothetical protein ACI9LG_003435 [Moritella dasanensis]
MQNLKGTMLGFLYIIAILALVCSSLLVIIFVVRLMDGKDNAKSALIVFSFITIVIAILIKRIKKSRELVLIGDIDNFIPKYAIEHSGLITATDLASETNYSLKEASIHLERNYHEGYCNKKVN